MTVNVNPTLSAPGTHLGNARSTAAAEPKVAAYTNGANVDNARQQRQKPDMVECRHSRRKGNGHHRIDPGLSQGMQAVGRRHQFLSGRRAHHNVLLVPTMYAIKHANGD